MGRDFTELEIYQLAENFIVKIYKITLTFPKEEIYGIISQLRRAAVLICRKLSFISEEDKYVLVQELDNLGIKLNNYIKYLRERKT